MRDAAGELDHFEAALDVALGVGEGLAVLGRQQPGEAVELLLRELEELEQHARAPLRIGRGPGRLRRRGIGDGSLDLRCRGQGDLGLHLAGIGIEHVAAATGRAGDRLAADEMADLAHGLTSLKERARVAAPLFHRQIAQLASCGKRLRPYLTARFGPVRSASRQGSECDKPYPAASGFTAARRALGAGMSKPVIFAISAAWDAEALVWSGHCDDIPSAADAPTLDELLTKISAMALDLLPDNHPDVDPASLFLQITALREAEAAAA